MSGLAAGPARAASTGAGEALRRDLAAIVGDRFASTGEGDRLSYARDLWPRLVLWAKNGRTPAPPQVVVWPKDAAQIAEVIRYAAARAVPVVPFGAGSGVCGGTVALEGGIVLDVKRLDRLKSVDLARREAVAEAGINGEVLEHGLAHRGATLGHFPSSIYCSTLGGWLAARSAGQCSSRYGKIEDMTLDLEFVSGEGELVRAKGRQGGVDLVQLLIGSEGTLGVVTGATLRIAPEPQARHFGGWKFGHVEEGVAAMQALLRAGLRPAVVRLYDEFDTLIAGKGAAEPTHGKRGLPLSVKRLGVKAGLTWPQLLNAFAERAPGGCLLVVVGEGSEAEMAEEGPAVAEVLAGRGGASLGEGPGRRWLARRHAVSYRQSPMIEAGAFVDTMEVATRWSGVAPLYRAVRDAVSPHAFIMAHFSHAYLEGCAIYFTFSGTGSGPAELERRYDLAWRSALSAVSQSGATISHHHGVGFSKATFMTAEHGEAMRLLRAAKRALDPHGILNPGKLGL